ncbi:MAG: Omp28-related outer membrane protein [Saprospiraceae bacterium]|nr:Omp28-related outer membrane protein [Saprospiraceae bacterium]
MKNLYLVAFAILFAFQADAQTKKYPLLEHFTNSWCSICASRNPAFYNALTNYQDQVHHISIHPSIPYQGCIFYQANTADNNARKDYYNVFSTPRVFANGTLTSNSTLITTAQLDQYTSEMSNLGIQVTETGFNSRTATVEVFTFGTAPSGNLKIFAALVEKEINYAAPNGENLHHDVLRKFVTSNQGDTFTPAQDGGKVTINYTYSIESGWAEPEMYLLVWIQDIDTKEVFNSGTRFDETISSVSSTNDEMLMIAPNPTSSFVNVTVENGKVQNLILSDLNGKTVFQMQNLNATGTFEVPMKDLNKGVYLLRIETNNGVQLEKIVKQ